jgi:hypothetical protein
MNLGPSAEKQLTQLVSDDLALAAHLDSDGTVEGLAMLNRDPRARGQAAGG